MLTCPAYLSVSLAPPTTGQGCGKVRDARPLASNFAGIGPTPRGIGDQSDMERGRGTLENKNSGKNIRVGQIRTVDKRLSLWPTGCMTRVRIGAVFGSWKVVSPTDKFRGSGTSRSQYWSCKCACGAQRDVAAIRLSSGQSYSCGCSERPLGSRMRKEQIANVWSRVRASLLDRAKKRKIPFELDRDVRTLVMSRCHYCNLPASIAFRHRGVLWVRNTIDRLDSGLGYTRDNCVACCWMCNVAKSDRSHKDFVAWLVRASKHQQVKTKNSSPSFCPTSSHLVPS